MKPVYLIVGVPGSGKTWTCKQLTHKFLYVAHDDHQERVYASILFTHTNSEKPVLGEIPFGLSKIQSQLEGHGLQVNPVFIVEHESVLKDRYQKRENRPILQGHLTRQHTYRERAYQLGSFVGTTNEVLEYLLNLPL